MGAALFVAATFHAALIFGVSFELPDAAASLNPPPNLEIILVRQRQKEPVESPDYLAQITQRGSGEQPEKARAKSPEPVEQHGADPTQKVASPQPASAAEPPMMAAPAQKAPPSEKRWRAQPSQKQQRGPRAAQLINRSMEIARLTVEISQSLKAYAKRPRLKSISASTKEYIYASYMEAWRRKVERIGNLNYPDEAKKQRIYGNLRLDVALKPDGSLHGVKLLRSSGHKILDDAAIRIVRLGAPYAAFSLQMREETDILHIIRTWQFLSTNRLFSAG
jgi:protein TonB